MHVPDACSGYAPGKEIHGCTQERLAVVVAPRWRDPGDTPVLAVGRWISGAPEDPHRGHFHATCGTLKVTRCKEVTGCSWTRRNCCSCSTPPAPQESPHVVCCHAWSLTHGWAEEEMPCPLDGSKEGCPARDGLPGEEEMPCPLDGSKEGCPARDGLPGEEEMPCPLDCSKERCP